MEDALLHDGSSIKRTKQNQLIFRREAYLGNTTKLRPAPNMFFKTRFSTNSMWLIERPIFPVGRRGENRANTAADSDVCLVCLCVPSSSSPLSRDDKTRQEEGAPLLKQPRARLVLPPLLYFDSRRRRQVLECCCCSSCCCQNLEC